MSMLLLFHASFCTVHLMHCTMLYLAHLYSYTLDNIELELEEPTEQAQAEETANTKPTEGKARCIPLIFLGFYFNY
jgi:hypothetical protein